MRCRTKLYVEAALLALASCVCAGVSAEHVAFALSEKGTLTAWYVAGPFPEPVESLSFPEGRLPGLGTKKSPWRFAANYPREALHLPQWRSAGYTYLFSRIFGSGRQCPVKMVHRLPLRVWVDGRPVRTAVHRGRWRSYSSITLEMEPGPRSVLVEVRGGVFAAYCDGADVHQITPEVSFPTLVEAVASSISVDGPRRGIQPEKPFTVQVGIEGSRAVFDGPIDVSVTLCREAGQRIEEKEIDRVWIEDLAAGSTVEFKPPEPRPFYRIETRVAAKGKTARASTAWTFNIAKVHERSRAVLNAASALSRESPAKANLELRAEKLCVLFDDYIFRSSFCRRVREELRAAAGPAEGARASGKPGLHECAYLSAIDDSPQPYLVYVPKHRAAPKAAPLIVFLHGYTPYLDKIEWDMMPASLFNLAEREGFLIAAAFARGNTDFQGVGEDDVLKVIGLVKKQFAVDERRIFLAGISMGGSGVWTIAAHHPHIFAGAVPVSGRNDYLFWHRYEDTPPHADLFCMGDFAYEIAENFRNLPVFCIHGGADSLVETEQSRRMVKKLEGLGFDVTYKEIKGADHWIWEEAFAQPELEDWLAEKVLDPAPRRVTYRTYSIRQHRAYWLDLTRITKWGRPAYVDAVLNPDRTVSMKTFNLDGPALCGGAAFKPDEKVRVKINGEQYVLRAGGAPARAGRTGPAGAFPGEKTPDLCGPFREVFSGPFRIVHGSEDKEGRTSALTFADQWRKFSRGRARPVQDTDVDEKMLRSCNLVLVGCRKTNKIIERVSKDIPFSLGKDSISISGKAFKRDNTGLIAVYPSPLAPGRYLGFVWGEVWGDHLPANHVWDEVPDFLVFTTAPSFGAERAEVLMTGYFDSRWKLSADTTWQP